jgi:hypothetical protein
LSGSRIPQYFRHFSIKKRGKAAIITPAGSSAAGEVHRKREGNPFYAGHLAGAFYVIDFGRSLLDVEICEPFTEVISAKTGHPSLIGTRLKMVDNKIAEVASLVRETRDWLFDEDNYLKYSSTEKWDIIPAKRAVTVEPSLRLHAIISRSFRITPPSTRCPGESHASISRVERTPILKMPPILPAPPEPFGRLCIAGSGPAPRSSQSLRCSSSTMSPHRLLLAP